MEIAPGLLSLFLDLCACQDVFAIVWSMKKKKKVELVWSPIPDYYSHSLSDGFCSFFYRG
jgi:hypothetical protein